MDRRFDPIFVLDSGLGGLTVVDALHKRLPDERVVYFGDTARLPYGSKTRDTVGAFVRQIIQWVLPMRPKHVVIACNTASALALDEARRAFPQLKISGVISPGARAAASLIQYTGQSVGVIATQATINSGAYQRALRQAAPRVTVHAQATPLLVPIIEEGRDADDPVVALVIKQYLRSMLKQDIDALVLGCTHYPLLRQAIERVVGPGVAVIDSAEQCAEDVAVRLAARDRLASGIDGRLELFVTDEPGRFGELAARFLGRAVDRPTRVAPETLYDVPAPVPLRQPA